MALKFTAGSMYFWWAIRYLRSCGRELFANVSFQTPLFHRYVEINYIQFFTTLGTVKISKRC